MIRSGTGDTVGYVVHPGDEWEVARGRRRHVVRGLVAGFAIGGALGGVAVAALADGVAASYGIEDVAIGVGVGGGIGAGVGALIGALSRTRRWQPVVRPGPRLDAGVSVAF